MWHHMQHSCAVRVVSNQSLQNFAFGILHERMRKLAFDISSRLSLMRLIKSLRQEL